MIHDESIRASFEANGLILGVDRATAGFWGGEQSGSGHSAPVVGTDPVRRPIGAKGAPLTWSDSEHLAEVDTCTSWTSTDQARCRPFVASAADRVRIRRRRKFVDEAIPH
jgi:hypothetical protein